MELTLPHSRDWIILAAPQHCSSNHEVLATEREPEGQAQRSNLGTAFGLHKIFMILIRNFRN